ncbi:hypothetical protein VFPFJ_00259 [Purpureocillium lilacinum]|uniref:Uncharacterized protein n=2 Tax=Purpureocillium lilacinum TaxID=33203 RepID=A0A179H9H7_PURLI|nr:hypothetical protein VFPFJ_00259 [Purpureocillium lilacinum]OAQ86191.1 hypothetical protein VFPBJ_00231 [Purpureocillium lilacinum]OAQ94150.1 hypothetical protein VFPFJ_00259 [Purpureocillium lilacinum]GJN67545.1 hypothetical protein PLICBS_001571 [Purpureocillium lilacinum]GJN81454.1 hypothetical protein PLIIFM63780_004988 [Purpureocillium lilacinum]
MKSGYTFVLAAAVAALCGTAFAIEGGTCDVYTQKCTAYVTEPVGRDRTGRTQYAVVPKYYSCSSSARCTRDGNHCDINAGTNSAVCR